MLIVCMTPPLLTLSIKVMIGDKSHRTLDIQPNLLEGFLQLTQVVLGGV